MLVDFHPDAPAVGADIVKATVKQFLFGHLAG